MPKKKKVYYFKKRLLFEKVQKVGIKKEKGWLYFIDAQGDISRVEMTRRLNAKEQAEAKAEEERIMEIKRKKALLTGDAYFEL